MSTGTIEFERKFLTTDHRWEDGVVEKIDMRAGYLTNNPDIKAYVTGKGHPYTLVIESPKTRTYYFDIPTEEHPEKIAAVLKNDPKKATRIRIENDEAFFFVKGSPLKEGSIGKEDLKVPIDMASAVEILDMLCPENEQITKTRHVVPYAGHVWQIDVFHGRNEGLVFGEIELTHEKEAFVRPPWIGEEVTQDPKYTNASISKHPFDTWREKPAPAAGKASPGRGPIIGPGR